MDGLVVDASSWLFKNLGRNFVSVEKKYDYWWSEFKYPIIPIKIYRWCNIF
ncbi:hypothetical protein [Staphylococcus xylosus]